MTTKRLFTGTYIRFDGIEKRYLELRDAFDGSSTGKWVEPENLHFTYQFIGDFEINRLKSLKSDLYPICKNYDNELQFIGASVFPDLRQPRVLHIGITDKAGVLNDIHANLDEQLKKYGYIPEKRKFIPHVTLQRIKEINKDKFMRNIENLKEFQFGNQSQFKVSLIESELTSKGPIYRIVL